MKSSVLQSEQERYLKVFCSSVCLFTLTLMCFHSGMKGYQNTPFLFVLTHHCSSYIFIFTFSPDSTAFPVMSLNNFNHVTTKPSPLTSLLNWWPLCEFLPCLKNKKVIFDSSLKFFSFLFSISAQKERKRKRRQKLLLLCPQYIWF